MRTNQAAKLVKDYIEAALPAAKVSYGFPKKFTQETLQVTYYHAMNVYTKAIGNKRIMTGFNFVVDIWETTQLKINAAADDFLEYCEKTPVSVETDATIAEPEALRPFRRSMLVQVKRGI